jgi:hypothetical protein
VTSGGTTHAERKRMLLARAAQERLELASDVDDLRAATQLSALFKALLPAFAVSKGLPMVFGLLTRTPILRTVLSHLISRFKHKPAHKPAKTARPGKAGKVAKLVGLVMLLLKGWRAVQGLRTIIAAATPPRHGFLSRVLATRR